MQHLYNLFLAIICLYFLKLNTRVVGSRDFNTNVNLFVEGNGFHRNIKYKININFHDPNCYISLHLNLPSSLYVNVDELADLRRTYQALICVKGEKDVESFAENALPQEVTVCSEVNKDIILSIPIHQRYHFATIEGGYKNITIPLPKIFLGCKHGIPHLNTSNIDLCSPCNELVKDWYNLSYIYANETYIWQIPVGQETYLKCVTLITLSTTIIGAVILLRTILKQKISQLKEAKLKMK